MLASSSGPAAWPEPVDTSASAPASTCGGDPSSWSSAYVSGGPGSGVVAAPASAASADPDRTMGGGSSSSPGDPVPVGPPGGFGPGSVADGGRDRSGTTGA